MQIVWLLLFLMYSGTAVAHNPIGPPDTLGFVLVKQVEGISIYERWFQRKPDEFAREVKAKFTVAAPAKSALALMRDETRGTEWNKRARTFKVLHDKDGVWFSYIEYDLPWPISNQDCVLRHHQTVSRNELKVEFRDVHHPAFPPQQRIQRIPEISGKWIFRETPHGLDVEYYVTTLPNATLPTWVTDPIIRNNLAETLSAFREILDGSTAPAATNEFD